MDEAFAMYTDGFLQKRGEDWKKTLLELETQSSGISDFKMLGSQLAPVTTSQLHRDSLCSRAVSGNKRYRHF